jgi:adenylyl-sulfate kinase
MRTVWITGLSGAGKTTLSAAIARQLRVRGCPVCLLDGDVVRQGLSRDLGFAPADRTENVRRVAEVARLANNCDIFAAVALVSPFEEDRRAARDIIGPDRYVEVFLDVPLSVCEARDVKGHYRRARADPTRKSSRRPTSGGGASSEASCTVSPAFAVAATSTEIAA